MGSDLASEDRSIILRLKLSIRGCLLTFACQHPFARIAGRPRPTPEGGYSAARVLNRPPRRTHNVVASPAAYGKKMRWGSMAWMEMHRPPTQRLP